MFTAWWKHALVEIIGEAGLKLHTGRSRNDQVAVDTRLFLKKAIGQVQQGLKALMGELLNQAGGTPMWWSPATPI